MDTNQKEERGERMDSKANPFNVFGDFDFAKMWGDRKIPGVDLEALLDSQRKNVEALTTANQVAMQGMETFAKRQSEILSQTMQEAATAVQQLATVGSPQEMTAKQTELTKSALEHALANMREAAEMIHHSNTEAFEVLSKRVSQSLDELKKTAASNDASDPDA